MLVKCNSSYSESTMISLLKIQTLLSLNGSLLLLKNGKTYGVEILDSGYSNVIDFAIIRGILQNYKFQKAKNKVDCKIYEFSGSRRPKNLTLRLRYLLRPKSAFTF